MPVLVQVAGECCGVGAVVQRMNEWGTSAIVHQVMQVHGWRLLIHSTGQGVECAFQLLLELRWDSDVAGKVMGGGVQGV